jgi:hypothetical protein
MFFEQFLSSFVAPAASDFKPSRHRQAGHPVQLVGVHPSPLEYCICACSFPACVLSRGAFASRSSFALGSCFACPLRGRGPLLWEQQWVQRSEQVSLRVRVIPVCTHLLCPFSADQSVRHRAPEHPAGWRLPQGQQPRGTVCRRPRRRRRLLLPRLRLPLLLVFVAFVVRCYPLCVWCPS